MRTEPPVDASALGRRGGWLDTILAWSLRQRIIVLVVAVGLVAWGVREVVRMPVDVFPDLTAPTVTVLTEAPGLSALEVERLVTVPLESAFSAASGKRRVRSSSAEGLSVVWVEFSHGVDIYRARQIVAEKMQLAAGRLPRQVAEPVLAPITSIMGEIMFIALRSNKLDSVRLRELADRQIRRRLLQVPGVAQVAPIGGHLRELQVRLEPSLLRAQGITPDQVISALRRASRHRWGGLLVRGGMEYSIEGTGRLKGRADLERVVVAVRKSVPVRVGDLGAVRMGPAFRRGVGSYNGKPAVVIGILKQPGANTLVLTRKIDQVLDDLGRTLPKDLIIERQGFRQAAFIQAAVSNVQRALLEGAVLVLIVLALFLLSARATVISVLSIPLSVLTTLLVLRLFDATINTMTLGGIAMAVGALVDDAVIDVENIFRRLRENALLAADARRPQLAVIFSASREIRSSIVFATLILMLVFVPLFFLSGVEGRMKGRSMPALLASLRKALGKVPGIVVNIGQPISHRINHMLSGTRSAIAVKLFGPDLDELRRYGEQIRNATSKVTGAVDVSLEPVVRVPQVRVTRDRTSSRASA